MPTVKNKQGILVTKVAPGNVNKNTAKPKFYKNAAKLTKEQSLELKQLIILGATPQKVVSKFKLSKNQYLAYCQIADANRDEIEKTLPKGPTETNVPVVVVPLAVGDLLDSHDEIRVVLKITK